MEKLNMQKFQMSFVSIGLLLCMTLTACNVSPIQSTSDSAESGIPNPASVYCEQNGTKLEIQTAADGSQSGVCVFPDGSTCDEWAYFRGECGLEAQTSPTPAITGEATIANASGGFMPPDTTEEISDWWGVIKSMEPAAQYDDYFERQDLGQIIYFGIDSIDPVIKSQIEVLRDSGKIVHLYGILHSNVPDYNGSQIQVTRIEIDE
jgi:putative hemolysin